MSNSSVDDYPSLLWVTIPPFLMISAYYVRKWYLDRRLKLHGIGKGAPGFQTNVRRLRVTPDIAARLRRGEEVSPEEIAASSVRAEEEERRGADATPPESKREEPKKKDVPSKPTNEWLPESITAPKKRAKGKKK